MQSQKLFNRKTCGKMEPSIVTTLECEEVRLDKTGQPENKAPATGDNNTSTNTAPAASVAASATAGTAATGVAFKAEDIGRITAVQQNSFEEQNRKAAERKKHQGERKKIMFIVGAVVIGLVILGLAIWLIVALVTQEPEDGLTPEERKIQQVQTSANELYSNANNNESGEDEGGDIVATKDYFDNIKNESTNDTERIQALLAELEFWSVKDQPDLALQAAREIGDFKDLNTDDAIRYCNAYMDAVTALDDPDSVNVDECDQFLMDNEGDPLEVREAEE